MSERSLKWLAGKSDLQRGRIRTANRPLICCYFRVLIMNEKLIQRAAIKYRNWMVSQSQVGIRTAVGEVSNSLDDVVKKSAQMYEWVRRLSKISTQRIQRIKWEGHKEEVYGGIVCPSVCKKIATNMIPDLGNDISVHAEYIATRLKNGAEQKIVIPLSLKDAIDEIRVITNAWEKVEFRGNILSVLIKDVTLNDGHEDVYLGNFWVHLNLTNPLANRKVESIDRIESTKGFSHPHVKGTRLCIGAGGLSSKDALCQGRLEDYFIIVEAVLRTYNEESPHEELNKWYNTDREGQFLCDRCEEFRDNDSSCWCYGCENTYCDLCCDGGCCAECEQWFCGECATSCNECGETLCIGCSVGCSGCHNGYCSSCLSNCAVCEESHCNSCKSACAYCGDPVCEGCTTTCGCCNDNCCDDCMDETCHQCGEDICKGCQTACDDCNKTICDNCYENSCEHCGTQMCGNCEHEHNCLLQKVGK